MKELFKTGLSFIILGIMYPASWQGIISNTPVAAVTNLVSSTTTVTTLEFQIEGYFLTSVHTDDGTAFIVEINEGTPILEAGAPDLQKLTTSIIIPGTAQTEVNILESEYQEFPLLDIVPSKGPLTRDIDPNTVPYEYGTTYEADEFYPGALAALSNPYILRDFRGQTVTVFPFQYNPTSKTLRVYTHIVLEVRESGISDINILDRDDPEVIAREYEKIYSRHFINYTNTRYNVLEEEGKMLVIANDSFMDSMEPFVDWKNMRGMPTELVSLSDVGGNANGIKNYVIDRFNANELCFLLLVGDINQMPSLTTNGTASDPSFGYISGNDYYPEIMVGRFSAENTAQVETQVNRTINYERTPFIEENWFNLGIGLASDQGSGIGDEGEADWQHMDNIRQKLLGFTYEEVDQFYDTNGGNSAMVANAVNAGRTIINYCGHGSNIAWTTTGFSNSHVNNLTNINTHPFIVSVACVNGAFDDGTCFAEAWLRATHNDEPAGAVVMAASTVNQQWATPMECQDEFNDILSEQFENNIKRTFGGIFYNATMQMVDSYNYNGEMEASNWHVFGDPSLLLRTDMPAFLVVSYDPIILINQTELLVEVDVEGALVALSNNGQLISNASVTGGVAVLDLGDAASTAGEWDLVITGFNIYPYESTVTILEPEGPYLLFGSYEIESAGGDNQIDFNEQVVLTIIASNVGINEASAVSASVTTESDAIEITSGNLSFSNIPASSEIGSTNPLIFLVAEGITDGQLVNFGIEFFSSEGSWIAAFEVELHAPVFEFGSYMLLVDDDNGIWDPGESAELHVNLLNTGSSGFWNYPGASIFTNNNYITITNPGENTWYGIDAGGSYEGIFDLIANQNTPTGTDIDFSLSWGYSEISNCEDDCLTNAEMDIILVVGHPTTLIWDPSTNHTSGDRLESYFSEIGFGGYNYITDSTPPELNFYKTAFIFLGVYPNNSVLSENQASGFVNILENGGNVYMEGNDTWAFDSQTSLHNMFGINGVSDGSGDLGTVLGLNGTFTEGLTMTYSGENAYIDRLSPAGGFPILENSNPSYFTAIAYQNEDTGYRTVGASHELGGFEGDDFNDYIASLLTFLNTGGSEEIECTLGDVNGDGSQNILDIVLQVNIIIGTGDSPSDNEFCAADMNIDGEVNILDIIMNVNIIIGGRLAVRSEQIADYSQISLLPHSAFLQANGPLLGIQMTISADNLIINDNLGMEIALNKTAEEYILLIYSLGGSALSGERVRLFTAESGFAVNSVIVVNSLGDGIDVGKTVEILPGTFTLGQNFPNPFNPQTQIQFTISDEENITLSVIDIRGRLVTHLAAGVFPAGNHFLTWDGRNQDGSELPSGMYICTLKNEGLSISRKMLMIK